MGARSVDPWDAAPRRVIPKGDGGGWRVRIEVRFAYGAVVLRVSGDIDANSAPELVTAILGAARGTETEVVVDLVKVTAIDAAGAEALQHAHNVLGVVPSPLTGQLVRLRLQHASETPLPLLTAPNLTALPDA